MEGTTMHIPVILSPSTRASGRCWRC